MKKFRSECTKNNNALYRAHEDRNKKEIKKSKESLDESVGALIDESMKCGAKENVIKVIEKYDDKLFKALNEKIDKILSKNGLSNRSNSTAESTENVSEKLIASDKKPAPAAFKRKKAEDSFSKSKVNNEKPIPAVYKRNAAGSFSTSKKNAHNNENVDNSVVSKNENLNVVAEEENKVNEVDAKAKEICKESTSLFKKCVSAGGNLLWWGVKAPFKCVGCVANGLWMGGCKAFEALDYSLEVIGKAKPFIDKVEKAKDVLNYRPLKKMIYHTLDMLIKKNPKGHMAIAGGKATIDTIKDMIKAGKENVGKVASFIGAKAGGLIGAGVGAVTSGVLGSVAGGGVSVVVSYIFNGFVSNLLSRSENVAEKMDNELQIAILRKYCSNQDTPVGKGALTIMTSLLSIGYFDDIKDEIDGKKNNFEKK